MQFWRVDLNVPNSLKKIDSDLLYLFQVCLPAAHLLPATAAADGTPGRRAEHTPGPCCAAPLGEVHCAPSRPTHSILRQCQNPRGVLCSGKLKCTITFEDFTRPVWCCGLVVLLLCLRWLPSAHCPPYFFYIRVNAFICNFGYLCVGVSWGSALCTQHHLHASHQWLVGSHQWDGQEQLPHTPAGCTLIHTAPYPRHSRDQLPAASWRGDQSVPWTYP